MRVALFVPCFVDGAYPKAAVAAVRLLESVGVVVEYPAEQTCCGQPAHNAGHAVHSARLARRFARVFEGYEQIVTPSGSCAAMVRQEYPELAPETAGVASRTHELCTFIAEVLGVRRIPVALEGRAVLHVGCHLERVLDGGGAARALLSGVEKLELLDPSLPPCCGFGGVFSVKHPEVSSAMGRSWLGRAFDHLPQDGASPTWLVSTDPSCLLHLGGLAARAGNGPRPVYIGEVLAGMAEEARPWG